MKRSKIYLFLISLLFVTNSCDDAEQKVSADDYKAPKLHIETPSLDSNSIEINLSGWYESDSRIPRSVISTQCGFYIYLNDNKDNTGKISLSDENDYTYDSKSNIVSFSKKTVLASFDSVYHVKAYLSLLTSNIEIVSDEVSFKLGSFDSYIKYGSPKLSEIKENSASVTMPITIARGIDLTSKTIQYGNSSIGFKTVSASPYYPDGLLFNIDNLIIGQTYQYWIEVKEGAYVAKSQTFEFTHHSVPTITTSTVTDITATSAVVGGQDIKENGSSLITKGIVWSKKPNPSSDDKEGIHTMGASTDDFTYTITGLLPGTTYHVRAFAGNNDGTGYGDDVEFTTDVLLPTVSTSDASSITSTSFISGGNVTDNGGADITARGIVWSTSVDPTVELTTKTSDGTGKGSYTSTATALQPNTIYYVRAYATNSKGTAYGEQITVQTNAQGSNEDVGNENYEW